VEVLSRALVEPYVRSSRYSKSLDSGLSPLLLQSPTACKRVVFTEAPGGIRVDSSEMLTRGTPLAVGPVV